MATMIMPLAGMEPTRRFEYDEAEERAFRMLSEGELFYVETDISEDPLTSTRHDHSLGGVSLETITAARNQSQSPVKKGPGSIETVSTSRTSSQDTDENENKAWLQPAARAPARRAISSNLDSFYYPNHNRISLKEAQQWDFSKKLEELAMSESRGRERSFSEPQLSSMRPGATHKKHGQVDRSEYRQAIMGTVTEGCSFTGWKMPTSMTGAQQQRQQQQQQLRTCRPRSDVCADSFASVNEGLQRAWRSIVGEENHGIGTLRSTRVGTSSRRASCTSTKTFEVSPNEADREALAKLGVVPEISYRGVEAPASMTFTMHIAGIRVVSTILGMHAEYNVCVKGGGRIWSKWQRFSKFKTIAACTQGDPDAAAAWRRVLRAKPHYRCLNPDYLAHKCNLLELFLQQVLFAMPTPALLLHFVTQKK